MPTSMLLAGSGTCGPLPLLLYSTVYVLDPFSYLPEPTRAVNSGDVAEGVTVCQRLRARHHHVSAQPAQDIGAHVEQPGLPSICGGQGMWQAAWRLSPHAVHTAIPYCQTARNSFFWGGGPKCLYFRRTGHDSQPLATAPDVWLGPESPVGHQLHQLPATASAAGGALARARLQQVGNGGRVVRVIRISTCIGTATPLQYALLPCLCQHRAPPTVVICLGPTSAQTSPERLGLESTAMS